MIIKDIRIKDIALLKNELKMLDYIIKERVNIEQYWLFKLKVYSAKHNKSEIEKYIKRNYGYQKMLFDYYDTRVHIICNSLDKLNDNDLGYIYDMLIYPIKIKEIIKKYQLTSDSHCYRKLDSLLKFMTKGVR